MTVPVIWWTANPESIARGYWDQGLIEDLLSGDAWSIPGGPEFQHIEAYPIPAAETLVVGAMVNRDLTALNGAVVIVPARHNADENSVVLLRAVLGSLRWAVVILTGDEEGAFPYERLRDLEHVVTWVMTPQPQRRYGEERLLGTGYPPGIRKVMAEWPPVAADGQGKRVPWAFLGQVTHERRLDCVAMLRARHDADQAILQETDGFTKGAPQSLYWDALAAAKAAPCPSGPLSPDSFRTFEALEAGCVPLADNVTPNGKHHNFWEAIGGVIPFPTVDGPWNRETHTINVVLDQYPRWNNLVFAWWQQYKRRLAWRLHLDIVNQSGAERDLTTTAAAITTVMVTSPTPHHPDTEHLETTVESVLDRLPGSELVLVFDGVRPEQEQRRTEYEEYTRRALWLCNTRWPNVVPIVLGDWHHQANATRVALDAVHSRHMLFVEHDTPLTGDIDWAAIIATLDAGELDVVRLHHETAIGDHHAHMMLDPMPHPDAWPFVRTYQWSQRPHVANVGWYRTRVLDRHFTEEARTMIEDVMHGIVSTAWNEYGLAGWSRFRLGIYAPQGNVQRSIHLDSRRVVHGVEKTGDPKYPMLFDYPDGVAPEGAPQPGRR